MLCFLILLFFMADFDVVMSGSLRAAVGRDETTLGRKVGR